jgi:hypothetical protein
MLLLFYIRLVDPHDHHHYGGYIFHFPPPIHSKALLLRQLLTDHPHPPNADLIDVIHDLLILSWTRKWFPTASNPIPDPTENVLMLTQLNRDGTFSRPQNVTKPIAQFQALLVCPFLFNLPTLLHLLSSQRYLIIRHAHRLAKLSTTAIDGELYFHVLETQFCQLEHWYKEENISTFRLLRMLTHKASSIAMASPSQPRIFWVNIGDHMTYQGTHFTFQNLRQMSHFAQDSILDLYNQLLLGLPIFAAHGTLHDNPSIYDANYSFINHGKNSLLLPDERVLLRAILANPALRDNYTYLDPHGNLVWKTSPINRWLKLYRDLHLWYMISIILNTSGPARGTELTSMRIKNILTAPRNLYIFGPHLVFTRRYHKMQAITGSDKNIPELLDAALAEVMRQDILHLRPVARFFAATVMPQNLDALDLYDSAAFVNLGRRFTTDDISEHLRQLTTRFLNEPLTMNDLRHILIAFKRMRHPALLSLSKPHQSHVANQAGHSRLVDLNYGTAENFALGAEEDIIHQYITNSMRWQADLRLVPGLSPSQLLFLSSPLILNLRRRKLLLSLWQDSLPQTLFACLL